MSWDFWSSNKASVLRHTQTTEDFILLLTPVRIDGDEWYTEAPAEASNSAPPVCSCCGSTDEVEVDDEETLCIHCREPYRCKACGAELRVEFTRLTTEDTDANCGDGSVYTNPSEEVVTECSACVYCQGKESFHQQDATGFRCVQQDNGEWQLVSLADLEKSEPVTEPSPVAEPAECEC